MIFAFIDGGGGGDGLQYFATINPLEQVVVVVVVVEQEPSLY